MLKATAWDAIRRERFNCTDEGLLAEIGKMPWETGDELVQG